MLKRGIHIPGSRDDGFNTGRQHFNDRECRCIPDKKRQRITNKSCNLTPSSSSSPRHAGEQSAPPYTCVYIFVPLPSPVQTFAALVSVGDLSLSSLEPLKTMTSFTLPAHSSPTSCCFRGSPTWELDSVLTSMASVERGSGMERRYMRSDGKLLEACEGELTVSVYARGL